MKNKKALLGILLAFVLLIGGAYSLYGRLGQDMAGEQMVVLAEEPTAAPSDQTLPAAQPTPRPIPAPDFTVYNEKGEPVSLSQYFGKPIVLNFWASWCGPCQSEMPDFHEKYEEYGDEYHFLMINMTDGSRETVESAAAFLQSNGYDFPPLFDTEYQAAMAYGARSLPTTFFIDARGHVVAQAVGPIRGDTLQKGMDMIAG